MKKFDMEKLQELQVECDVFYQELFGIVMNACAPYGLRYDLNHHRGVFYETEGNWRKDLGVGPIAWNGNNSYVMVQYADNTISAKFSYGPRLPITKQLLNILLDSDEYRIKRQEFTDIWQRHNAWKDIEVFRKEFKVWVGVCVTYYKYIETVVEDLIAKYNEVCKNINIPEPPQNVYI